MDNHLVGLWDKKHKLITKWKKKRKLNKSLHNIITKLTAEAHDYAQQLAITNWLNLCEKLSSQLHTSNPWAILRSMLGQGQATHTLTKLQLRTPKTPAELEKAFLQHYFPSSSAPPTPFSAPSWPTSSGADSPFTLPELRRAFSSFQRNTSPGPDGIAYPLLRNLPDPHLSHLLSIINDSRLSGNLPDSWRLAFLYPSLANPLLLSPTLDPSPLPRA